MKNLLKTPTTRDEHLDIYRGLTMIYISCVIHLCWLGLLPWYVLSALLIEMPLIFYQTGASYSLSKTKTYPKFLWGRIKRVLFPYWICLFFVFSGLYAIDFLLGKNLIGPITNPLFLIDSGKLPIINVPFVTSHLWFILPYMVLSMTLPLLYATYKKIGNYLILVVIAVLFAFYLYQSYSHHEFYTLTMVLFYMAFTVAGFAYKQKVTIKVKLMTIATCTILGYYLYHNGIYSLDMQINKFPPNIMFFVFCVAVILSFEPLLRKIAIWLYREPTIAKIIDIYSQKGFSIYIYQFVGYLIIFTVLKLLHIDVATLSVLPKILIVFVIFCVLLFLNGVIGMLAAKIENMIINNKTWSLKKK